MLTQEQAGRAAAVLLGGTALFQIGLAAGAPWGAAAWGGRHPGRLPPAMRVASGCAAAALTLLAGVAANPRWHPSGRRRMLRSASVSLAVGTVANAASPSTEERAWAPVNAAASVLLWRTAGSGEPQASEPPTSTLPAGGPNEVSASGNRPDPNLRH